MKARAKSGVKKATRARKPQTVGESVIQGLKEAIAWTKGENDNVRVTLVHVPEVDVRNVRVKMGLSQAQFATNVWLSAGYAEELGRTPTRPRVCCWRSSRSTRRRSRTCCGRLVEIKSGAKAPRGINPALQN